MENTAADISGIGNDNLGKVRRITRNFASDTCNLRFLPLPSSDADFGDVDFQQ
ncbi:hypothetical protein [Tardiphaga sp.]|uniref:hypothetical protein n=1 Tax=Tardiphaga sp. TaxID=1926292 RepID=UPI003529F7D9